MRDYVLLKDLPGAKAGCLVEYDEDERKYIVRSSGLQYRFSTKLVMHEPNWFGDNSNDRDDEIDMPEIPRGPFSDPRVFILERKVDALSKAFLEHLRGR